MEHQSRIQEIADLIEQLSRPITLAYSGGKDSSAVIKIFWAAIKMLQQKSPNIEIVYCDTEVENIIVDKYVKQTLQDISAEAQSCDLPINCKIIYPKVEQSFFVRMIGRGYVPPTRSFRWCTSDIRIRPFRHYLRNGSEKKFIAVGTRFGESQQRDRSLSKIFDSEHRLLQRQAENFAEATLITPIIDYNLEDVWDAVCSLREPYAVSATKLAAIYRDGSGECPAIRDFKDKPCTKARFGCWTCTVVRKDKSAERMIEAGHLELLPFLKFRSWLTEIRNDARLRCVARRNGSQGLGPFTLNARKMILRELKALEIETGRKILTNDHEKKIAQLIKQDRRCPRYMALERNILTESTDF